MSVAVIFPMVDPPYAVAGGGGVGGGGAKGRYFAKVENREIFLRCVEIYTPRDQVVQRIIVVSPDDLQVMQEKYSAHLGFQGVTVTAGGADWFSCVRRGLEKLQELEHNGGAITDTVIIHDAACPAVPFPLLDALEEALAKNKEAAGIVAVLPSHSPFADLSGKMLSEYVDMAKVFEVQSPQVYRRKPLADVYAARGKASGQQSFVDDAELLMGAGHKIATIPGSRLNQRVDSEEMIRLAKDLIAHLPKPKPKTPLNPFGEAEW